MASVMEEMRALREERDSLKEENKMLKVQVDILIKNSQSFTESLHDIKISLGTAVANCKSIINSVIKKALIFLCFTLSHCPYVCFNSSSSDTKSIDVRKFSLCC